MKPETRLLIESISWNAYPERGDVEKICEHLQKSIDQLPISLRKNVDKIKITRLNVSSKK